MLFATFAQPLTSRMEIAATVSRTIAEQPVTDLHTHCYAPGFGHSADGTGKGLLLWGIDELVTYHYMVAEVYRMVPASELPYEQFWKMTKRQQADHIWKHLFVERTPISEACRGVLTTLTKLGLNPNEKTLEPYREYFRRLDAGEYIDRVMQIANVDSITMTNPVFDDHERTIWEQNPLVGNDRRFTAVLRVDPMLRDWPAAAKKMAAMGYKVHGQLTEPVIAEIQRFLHHWIDTMHAIYVAVSLPPTFTYPSSRIHGEENHGETVLEKALLPVLAERKMPFAMMIGSRLRVNPALGDAGDMVGKSDILSVANLAAGFPQNKFLVTMLARENQHELCVAARKFGNIMPFGCWWFLNNPSLIEEMTRMRLELLGTSFCPQHSDARILDQLIYKWDHSRKIIARVLTDKYADSVEAGFRLTEAHVKRDVGLLLRDNFRNFLTV